MKLYNMGFYPKKRCSELQITQHIRFGLMPLPFGTLLPSVITSYMLETLDEIAVIGKELKWMWIIFMRIRRS